MSKHPSLLAYFGHHKCASQWIQSIIRDVCLLSNLRCVQLSRVEDLKGADFTRFVTDQQPDFLLFSNAEIQEARRLDNVRGFHVVRDPRDLLVSAYFSHLHSHPVKNWPELSEHRQRLQAVDKRTGLLLEMEFSAWVLAAMGNWDYAQPNVLEMRMEHLVASPYEKMVEIFTFLELTKEPKASIGYKEQFLTLSTAALGHMQRVGLVAARTQLAALVAPKKSPAQNGATQGSQHDGRRGDEQVASVNVSVGRSSSPSWLNQWRLRRRTIDLANLLLVIYRHRFASKSKGRGQGQEDVNSHYRKGTPNDWINHFEPVHIDYFKRNYNDVLLKLGYESTPDW